MKASLFLSKKSTLFTLICLLFLTLCQNDLLAADSQILIRQDLERAKERRQEIQTSYNTFRKQINISIAGRDYERLRMLFESADSANVELEYAPAEAVERTEGSVSLKEFSTIKSRNSISLGLLINFVPVEILRENNTKIELANLFDYMLMLDDAELVEIIFPRYQKYHFGLLFMTEGEIDSLYPDTEEGTAQFGPAFTKVMVIAHDMLVGTLREGLYKSFLALAERLPKSITRSGKKIPVRNSILQAKIVPTATGPQFLSLAKLKKSKTKTYQAKFYAGLEQVITYLTAAAQVCIPEELGTQFDGTLAAADKLPDPK
jgi:hypothetical protein